MVVKTYRYQYKDMIGWMKRVFGDERVRTIDLSIGQAPCMTRGRDAVSLLSNISWEEKISFHDTVMAIIFRSLIDLKGRTRTFVFERRKKFGITYMVFQDLPVKEMRDMLLDYCAKKKQEENLPCIIGIAQNYSDVEKPQTQLVYMEY